MRTLVAVVVCAVEFVAYFGAMAALGLVGQPPQPGDSPIQKIMTIAPGLLIMGLTWSGITGRGIPNWLDPLGFRRILDKPVVNTPDPVSDAREPHEAHETVDGAG